MGQGPQPATAGRVSGPPWGGRGVGWLVTGEDTIAGRDQQVERAIGGGSPATARKATLVILALGLIAVVWAGVARYTSREHRAGKIQIDADTAQVLGVMGAPAIRCGDAPLDHLRDAFPAGTPTGPVTMAVSVGALGTASLLTVSFTLG